MFKKSFLSEKLWFELLVKYLAKYSYMSLRLCEFLQLILTLDLHMSLQQVSLILKKRNENK